MTAPAARHTNADLFAACREFLATPDGDDHRTRAERLLADPRRGCACARAASPCRVCRSVIALAADAVARIPAPRPAPAEALPQGVAVVWARQVVRQHRTRRTRQVAS